MEKVIEREKAGYESLYDSDVMDIMDECKRRGVPFTRQDLIDAGLESESDDF